MTYEDIRDYIDKTTIKLARQSGRSDALYLNMFRDAIEKQIPKKPMDIRTWVNDRLKAGICPNCNDGLNSDMNYCSNCGQALDWSNEQ